MGIDDKTGRVNPLSYQEVQETTNLLGSLASEGVVPQVLLDIETVTVIEDEDSYGCFPIQRPMYQSINGKLYQCNVWQLQLSQ